MNIFWNDTFLAWDTFQLALVLAKDNIHDSMNHAMLSAQEDVLAIVDLHNYDPPPLKNSPNETFSIAVNAGLEQINAELQVRRCYKCT